MKVFLTGATGFIGSHLVPILQSAGHHVIGLARSTNAVEQLEQSGVEPYYGNLENPDKLSLAAHMADAVIHTAFDHNFANFLDNCEKDKRVISALGESLTNTQKPLIITSAVGMGDPGDGTLSLENIFNPKTFNPRVASELAGNLLLEKGVDVRVVRLPQVHNRLKQGLISPYLQLASQQGVAAYPEDGCNGWAACHLSDVVKLYLKVLEGGVAGHRYNAVAERAITFKSIAEAVGLALGVPVKSVDKASLHEQFGWFAIFVNKNMSASGEWTQQALDWQPLGPGLMEDIRAAEFSS